MHAEGDPVSRSGFARRDMAMDLIAKATVIIKARDGDGTFRHDMEAIRLGRSFFLGRRVLDNSGPVWFRQLLSGGAMPLSGSDAIIEALRHTRRHVPLDSFIPYC